MTDTESPKLWLKHTGLRYVKHLGHTLPAYECPDCGESTVNQVLSGEDEHWMCGFWDEDPQACGWRWDIHHGVCGIRIKMEE